MVTKIQEGKYQGIFLKSLKNLWQLYLNLVVCTNL